MRGAIPPFTQFALMVWYLVKDRDIFATAFTLQYFTDGVHLVINICAVNTRI